MSTATATQEAAVPSTNGHNTGGENTPFKKHVFRYVTIASLKSADYNPPNRVEAHRLESLMDSIEAIGLIYPILITKENNLADGHRRCAAVKALGWKEIPAIVVDNNRDLIYANVGANAKRLTGNDALYVYLKNKNAVMGPIKKILSRAESQLGKNLLRKIYDKGLSISIYSRAHAVATYCGLESDKDVQDITKWLLETGMNFRIRSIVDAGVSAKTILNAVKNNKPLKAEFVEQ